MNKITDAEELHFAGSEGEFARVLAYTNEARAAAETPEAKQMREEKLAQCEAERCIRSEEIFNRKRWTREEAVRWVAFRDKHALERSIRAAVLYDLSESLPYPDGNSLFIEAETDGRITPYQDDRGRTWYLSDQVRGAFPEPTVVVADLSDGDLDKVIREIADKLGRVPGQNKCAHIVRKTYPKVGRDRIRKRFPTLFPGLKQGRGARKKPEI